MTSIHITRFTQVLLLAATTAALAVPGAAFGDSTPTRTGTDAVATTQPLDWVERFAAAHPYGIVTSAVPRDAALGSQTSAAAHPYETVTSGVPRDAALGTQTSAAADRSARRSTPSATPQSPPAPSGARTPRVRFSPTARSRGVSSASGRRREWSDRAAAGSHAGSAGRAWTPRNRLTGCAPERQRFTERDREEAPTGVPPRLRTSAGRAVWRPFPSSTCPTRP